MTILLSKVKNRFKSAWIEFNKRLDIDHYFEFKGKRIHLCDNVRLWEYLKEPDTVRWIESFRPSDVVYDIGANVGAYTLIMSVFARQVYAFEPAMMNYALLCRNIITNLRKQGVSDNITPLNVALSTESGMETLNYVNLNDGKSGHQIGDRTIDGVGQVFEPVMRQHIMSVSLDFLVEAFKFPVPQHIKIDVDGLEWNILQGASSLLKDPSVKSLMVEVTKDSLEEKDIKDFMNERQFELKAEYRVTDPPEEVFNLFFER